MSKKDKVKLTLTLTEEAYALIRAAGTIYGLKPKAYLKLIATQCALEDLERLGNVISCDYAAQPECCGDEECCCKDGECCRGEECCCKDGECCKGEECCCKDDAECCAKAEEPAPCCGCCCEAEAAPAEEAPAEAAPAEEAPAEEAPAAEAPAEEVPAAAEPAEKPAVKPTMKRRGRKNRR